MRTKAILACALLAVVLALPADAKKRPRVPFDTGRTVTATSLEGTREITLPVRSDWRGDDEVYIPNWGWTRCVFRSCIYTVRRYYFHFWEAQRQHGLERGILGPLLGIE